jgi:hypothetical protein
VRKRAIAAVATVVVLGIGAASFVVGRATAGPEAVRTVVVIKAPSPKPTSVATTTTPTSSPPPPPTVPPPTTTTVALGTVPDAVTIAAEAGLTPAESAITDAGFTYQVDRTTSGACWIPGLSGGQVWNTNDLLGQDPGGGTTAPVGSQVTLVVC